MAQQYNWPGNSCQVKDKCVGNPDSGTPLNEDTPLIINDLRSPYPAGSTHTTSACTRGNSNFVQPNCVYACVHVIYVRCRTKTCKVSKRVALKLESQGFLFKQTTFSSQKNINSFRSCIKKRLFCHS